MFPYAIYIYVYIHFLMLYIYNTIKSYSLYFKNYCSRYSIKCNINVVNKFKLVKIYLKFKNRLIFINFY